MAQGNYQKMGGNREGEAMKDAVNEGEGVETDAGNADESAEESNGGLMQNTPQGSRILGDDLPMVHAADRGNMLNEDYNVDRSPDATNRIGGLERFTGSDPVETCYPVGDRRDEGSHSPQYKGGK